MMVSLLPVLKFLHPADPALQSYFWVTKKDQCWETRGLRRIDQNRVADGSFGDKLRNFTPFLNNWEPVARLHRV